MSTRLADCFKAIEANPDDLSLRRDRNKLTQIADWLRRGAPFVR